MEAESFEINEDEGKGEEIDNTKKNNGREEEKTERNMWI